MTEKFQSVSVHRVGCRHPGDLSQVQALVDQGLLNPVEIVAVMGKTEGNGCVNDHTRDYASVMWAQWLANYLDCPVDQVHTRVPLIMSGGTEGVLSPHFTIFSRKTALRGDKAFERGMVIGIGHTADFRPEEIGRMQQVLATQAAVLHAMNDAGIKNPDDVHFVQVKCPLLTAEKIKLARDQGAQAVTTDTYESMSYSRGASALGVALALDEISPDQCSDAAILKDMALFSTRASVSAGIELDNNLVVVMGMAEHGVSSLSIGHAVMQDAIDAKGVVKLLEDELQSGTSTLINLLAKAEADPSGSVRGMRHTMLDDSDINSTRHARAVVGGVLASVSGMTALYVSGGAEHQGPPGGGPVAALFDRRSLLAN